MIAFLGFGGSLALFILQILGVIAISGWLIALPALVVLGLALLQVVFGALAVATVKNQIDK